MYKTKNTYYNVIILDKKNSNNDVLQIYIFANVVISNLHLKKCLNVINVLTIYKRYVSIYKIYIVYTYKTYLTYFIN